MRLRPFVRAMNPRQPPGQSSIVKVAQDGCHVTFQLCGRHTGIYHCQGATLKTTVNISFEHNIGNQD